MSDDRYTLKDMREAFDAGFDVSDELWSGILPVSSKSPKHVSELDRLFDEHMRQRGE